MACVECVYYQRSPKVFSKLELEALIDTRFPNSASNACNYTLKDMEFRYRHYMTTRYQNWINTEYPVVLHQLTLATDLFSNILSYIQSPFIIDDIGQYIMIYNNLTLYFGDDKLKRHQLALRTHRQIYGY